MLNGWPLSYLKRAGAGGGGGGPTAFLQGGYLTSETNGSITVGILANGFEMHSYSLGTFNYPWLTPQTGMADYDVRMQVLSGSTPTGSEINTWLSLDADRYWFLAAGSFGRLAEVRIEIRLRASGAIAASADYTLNSPSGN